MKLPSGCALAVCIAAAAQAGAQEAATPAESEVLVQGIVYRDRLEAAPPVLEYGLDFFQQFEPLTVGDMLKRVPGVGFLSDVLEYDGVRMRGLDPGYTKILVNGRKLPGSEADRSFWVDRIPAELVDRIEIVRSASADTSAEGIGGALNIVLKKDVDLEGGYVRGGALHFDDDEVEGSFASVYGGKAGDYSFRLGANAQGRHNPKSKVTEFADDAGEPSARELESDVRDGNDYSFNAALSGPLGPLELELATFLVRTDREEREDVAAFEWDDGELVDDGIEAQDEDIGQSNYAFEGSLTLPTASGGRTRLDLSYARFEDDIVATAFEADAGDALEAVEREINDSTDVEKGATLSHAMELPRGKLKLGVDFLDKRRDADIAVFEIEDGELVDDTPADGRYALEERRVDPFVKYELESGPLTLEAGLRHESTRMDLRGVDGSSTADFDVLAPSLHAKWSLDGAARLNASIARTVRRPDFNLLAPYELAEEPADEDRLRGNPELLPERAWGIDLGYERRIGSRGIIGLNLLYRDIRDVIELTSTGEPSGDGGLVFTPRNLRDAQVWGAELDASMPLAMLGLEHTGVFVNAAWLDSRVDDVILGGERRLQNQPGHIVNAGFIQSLPAVGVAFGASYRKQGAGTQVVLGELRETSYGGDLEMFVEKRLGRTWIARAAASNLLDAEKVESIRNYDGDSAADLADAMRASAVDEFERESEQAGPVFQLVVRATF
jgi:outer membrane receptor for ferrienterochelin and colicins